MLKKKKSVVLNRIIYKAASRLGFYSYHNENFLYIIIVNRFMRIGGQTASVGFLFSVEKSNT